MFNYIHIIELNVIVFVVIVDEIISRVVLR